MLEFLAYAYALAIIPCGWLVGASYGYRWRSAPLHRKLFYLLTSPFRVAKYMLFD